MAAFEHRDLAGAKDIRDYLALWVPTSPSSSAWRALCAPDPRAFDLRPMGALTPGGCYGGAGVREPDGF